MDRFNITVIGAGVIGLTLAEELSLHHESVFLVEILLPIVKWRLE